MAAIDYLNPAPLMWDFEHAPECYRLAGGYAISYTTPANCARQLASGEADLGLVPVAAYAVNPSLRIVPGCVIASRDYVRSILLIVGASCASSGGIDAIRRVAVDTSSMTSVAYTRILFERFWKRSVEFVSHPPNLESMLSVADAAMLIGDPALLALEQADSRRRDTGEELLYVDLAHEWRVRTGLPWISAFWAVRSQAFEESRFPGEQLILDLQSSRDHGLAHVNSLAAEWSLRIGLAPTIIEAYLTENIHYVFDEECRRGLELFFRYAEEGGILPPVSGLKFV